MGKVLDAAVTEAEDGWAFQCPGVQGSPCEGRDGTPFSSTGWPTKKHARARGQQHVNDHKLGAEVIAAVRTAVREAEAAALVDVDPEDIEAVQAARLEARAGVDRAAILAEVSAASEFAPMQELDTFRREQGLVVNDDGSVSVEDI